MLQHILLSKIKRLWMLFLRQSEDSGQHMRNLSIVILLLSGCYSSDNSASHQEVNGCYAVFRCEKVESYGEIYFASDSVYEYGLDYGFLHQSYTLRSDGRILIDGHESVDLYVRSGMLMSMDGALRIIEMSTPYYLNHKLIDSLGKNREWNRNRYIDFLAHRMQVLERHCRE